MSTLSEKDSLFVEFAVNGNMLSKQQIEICKQSEEELSIAVASHGFLSPQQIANVYNKVEEKMASGKKVAVVKVDVHQPDLLDEKVVALAREKGWISEEDEHNCRKQRKKLYDLGYNPQLSAILYSAKCLSKENLVTLYEEIGDGKVNVVEKSLRFAENSLPTIPTIGTLQRISRHEVIQNTPVTSETMHMIDKMEAVVSQISTPQIDIASELNQNEPQPVPDDVVEEVVENEVQVEASAVTSPVPMEISADMEKILQYLQTIDNKLTRLQQDNEAIATQALSHEEMEERFDSEEIPDDIKRLIKRLRHVSEEEVHMAIRDGIALENCYIPCVTSPNPVVVKKVRITNCIVDSLDLSNIEFKNHVDFGNSRFLTKISFRESKFIKDATFKSCEFLNGADFGKTEFSGKTTFNSSAFRRYVNFNRSNFGTKTIFTRCYFAKGVKYGEVEFKGSASFNDIYVDHRFYIDKCKFKDTSTFSGARFADIADFGRSSFEKEVKFVGAIFMKWGSFKNCKFKGSSNFNSLNITGDLAFDNAHFDSVVNLRAISASRNVSLQNVKVGEDATFKFLDAHIGRLFISINSLKGHLDSHIQSDYKVAQKEYGLLKNNFREINEYEKEDWAYLMEKRMERMSIKVKGPFSALKRFSNWLALDIACGYGTKPINILMTSLSMLVFFALFFFAVGKGEFVPSAELALQRGEIEAQDMSFLEAIQVSFRTFTNASIEGPVPFADSWINYMMMFESFFGFFVMTVLVVTFSRKVVR